MRLKAEPARGVPTEKIAEGFLFDRGENLMSDIEQLHNRAMDLAEKAFLAKRKGQIEDAKSLFLQALNLEYQIASTMRPVQEVEPTRSILYRSAAALAYHAEDYICSLQLVADGLRGYPPPEIEKEFKNLQSNIYKEAV